MRGNISTINFFNIPKNNFLPIIDMLIIISQNLVSNNI